MPDGEVAVPVDSLEEGDALWMQRDDVDELVKAGYLFKVDDYDDHVCRVKITGHADDTTEAADDG